MLKNNMNVIFIGGFFPEQYTNTIISKSKLQVQYAANTFQWAFIKGLEQNLNKSIKLITAPFIGWFPKYYKELFIKTKYFSNNNENQLGVLVGYLNFPLIKNIFKYKNLKKHIKKTIIPDYKNVIIVYSLDLVYIKAAIKIKEEYPNVKVCVIITDLHEFPGDASVMYKLYIKYIEKPSSYKLLNKVDCFVVLVDKMIDYLKLQSKIWIRIEGIYDDQTINKFLKLENNDTNKIVLYTGSLDYRYGIKELLDAFELIKGIEFNLWICGGGPGIELVLSRAKEDARIKYFGIVSKEKVNELQAKATILVNPRNSAGEYNSYSFPSKTIEYLASGTPTLMYKLDGIPLEYYEHCYFIDESSVENLANAIYNTCQLDKDILRLKGNLAREFIIKNKTAKKQCGKVLNMLIEI